MAEEHKGSEKSLRAPTLTAPIEGKAVEDVSAVTFRWEAVEGAASYQLQVAADEAFSDLILNVEVGKGTSRTVKGAFHERDKDYFWRVRSKDKGGNWGAYSDAFQFSAPTEEQLDQRVAEAQRPDEVEERGPAAELITAAGKEVAAQVTGDERYEREAQEMGVAEEGIPVKQIVILTATTLFIIAALVIVVFWIYLVTTENIITGTQASIDYPEVREVQAEATRQLTQYEIVDRDEEVYRIPIDRAIDLIVREYETPEDLPVIPAPEVE